MAERFDVSQDGATLAGNGPSETGRFARDSAQNIHSGYAKRQGFFVLGRPRT